MKTLTIILVFISCAALAVPTGNTAMTKRAVKSGSQSKSKFKSDVKAINAASSKTKAVAKANTNPSPAISSGGKLSTNIDFNDQLVGGKYQSPMEALSVVEDEKSIDDLIGVRKNFHDREERSKAMR